MSVVSSYFTIYACAALKEWLDRIGHMDFLFGEPSFVKSLDPTKTETKAFIIAPEGLKLASTLQQKRLARECADWIRQKVDIKTVCQTGFLHGKLYHVANDGQDAVAILGSSNFTPRGLGLQDIGSNIELNLIASDPADRDQLKAWFDRLWADPNLVKDVEAADGSNTALYDGLLKKAVESIVAAFRKRVATGLQTGRGFKIPDRKDQAQDTTDFELVTWLVIKKP